MALTAHGPYYVNLISKETDKVAASMERVLKTARVAHAAGAGSITFHAGYYQKRKPEEAYRGIKRVIEQVVETLKSEGIEVWVRPETTGKATQWGSLEELIRLSQEVDMVMPCVDFSHLHARTAGKFNSREEWEGVMGQLEEGLGKPGLQEMHAHISGIEYTGKGERKHLMLEESDLEWQTVLRVMHDFGCRGVVVCESPIIEQDALLMQQFWKTP